MQHWRAVRQWSWAFGALGLLPPYCDGHWPGGNGGNGGSAHHGGAAGDGGTADSGAGGASEAGAGGDSSSLPDRVIEPLLGCADGESGKATPGTFDVLPAPSFDMPAPDFAWLTDWSGDGSTAVGYYTTPPDEEALGAIFVRWQRETGFVVVAKIRLELAHYFESPRALTSCDASVTALRHGDGSVWTSNGVADIRAEQSELFHDLLTLSEDGSSLSYFTGIRDQVRPWTMWHSTRGPTASLLLDSVHSLSWDGLTAYGSAACWTQPEPCQPGTPFRWNPLGGGQQLNAEIPSLVVAADGETFVYDSGENQIGIWSSASNELLDCGAPCDAIAWSSRAQIILANVGGEATLWTRVHGFRPLASLLTLPPGWTVTPTGISLDGWTITGTASSEATPFAYFRATLNADAYQ
jgi:hypothetical protein